MRPFIIRPKPRNRRYRLFHHGGRERLWKWFAVGTEKTSHARASRYALILLGALVSFGGQAISEGVASLSPQNGHSTESSSTIEYGRVRVCGGLVASVNRSWQVAVERGHRPVAAFKAMAPVAPWSATKRPSGDFY